MGGIIEVKNSKWLKYCLFQNLSVAFKGGVKINEFFEGPA